MTSYSFQSCLYAGSQRHTVRAAQVRDTYRPGRCNPGCVNPHPDGNTRMHARATVTVTSSESRPYDEARPRLIELQLDERFSGDIEGESPVRALQVEEEDHSARIASMQRFSGRLKGRYGTFVLQGREVVQNGKITAKWSVCPGSGTGELIGLRGGGGFDGEFGKGSEGWLDYWFEDPTHSR